MLVVAAAATVEAMDFKDHFLRRNQRRMRKGAQLARLPHDGVQLHAVAVPLFQGLPDARGRWQGQAEFTLHAGTALVPQRLRLACRRDSQRAATIRLTLAFPSMSSAMTWSFSIGSPFMCMRMAA